MTLLALVPKRGSFVFVKAQPTKRMNDESTPPALRVQMYGSGESYKLLLEQNKQIKKVIVDLYSLKQLILPHPAQTPFRKHRLEPHAETMSILLNGKKKYRINVLSGFHS